MKHGELFASSCLAMGFIAVSFILLFIEPGMGFEEVADFFDPEKVLRGAASPAWFVENLIYLGFGAALVYLAANADDRYLLSSGLIAGTLFFFLGVAGQLLERLPGFITEPGNLHAAVLGLLTVRFAVLRTAVFALAVFAWRTTREPGRQGAAAAVWRIFGFLVLAGGTVFLFVFIPVPLLFALWAVWLTIRKALSVQRATGG